MGDPRKRRRKYSKPMHPWQKERIGEEKILLEEYGLKNKREVWKADSLLRNFKRHAKRLINLSTKQAEIESTQLLKKLKSLGLLEENAKIEDVLGVSLKDILERRLQTVVYRKKLARNINQVRQFIIHRHIAVGDKVVDVPSYLVQTEEEAKIDFRPTSPLFNPDHSERVIEEKQLKKKTVKKKVKKKQE